MGGGERKRQTDVEDGEREGGEEKTDVEDGEGDGRGEDRQTLRMEREREEKTDRR